MSDCLAVFLVKQFNLGLLKPYAEILELGQEIVISIRSSADDIKLRETKYQDLLVLYQTGQNVGRVLSKVGEVAGGKGKGIAEVGELISKTLKLCEALHLLIKDLQNGKTHKRVESLIEEKKILEKLSAVFDKIDRVDGVKLTSRRAPDGNGTQKTAVPDVDPDLLKRFAKDAIALEQKLSHGAMDNPKSDPSLKDATQSGTNLKTTTGIWSTSFLTTVFNFVLSGIELFKKVENWRVKQVYDSTGLINILEVLLSALGVVTKKVKETSSAVKIILEDHLSATPPLKCDHHHGNSRIVDFFATVEELAQIEEFQQLSPEPE